MVSRYGAALVLVVGLAAGCSESSPTNLPTQVPTSPGQGAPTGPFAFTRYPIDLNSRSQVVQIGMTQAGSISWRVSFGGLGSEGLSIFAPADGTVTALSSDSHGAVLNVLAAEGVQYQLDSAESFSVSVGQTIRAGDLVGRRRIDSRQRELGVFLSMRKPTPSFTFLRPDRYPPEILYAADPVLHFTKTLREELAPILAPSGEGAGRLSFDEAGTLMGQWYDPALPPPDSLNPLTRNSRLWFFEPAGTSSVHVVFPGPHDVAASGRPQDHPGFRHPRGVRPGDGPVAFRMEPLTPGANTMILLVEMLDSGRVRVESFDTYYTPSPSAFTHRAREFTR